MTFDVDSRDLQAVLPPLLDAACLALFYWRESVLKSKLQAAYNPAKGGRSWSIAILLLLLCLPTARAQDHFLAQQSTDAPAAAQAAQVSQRQALELVRARFPGNVISINEIQQRGELVYRVRLDNDGNIFTVYVNAVTGAITREQ